MDWAPIVLFAYARLNHLQRTVDALLQNEGAAESDVIVYSDGPAGDHDAAQVAEVRSYLKRLRGFRSINIVERTENWGLSKSVVSGITEVCSARDRVIVVEDDLVTSPYFLRFLNEGLHLYAAEDRVSSIHAYTPATRFALPETFFIRDPGCWGWATWRRSWREFESDGAKILAAIQSRGQLNEFDWGGAYYYSHLLRDQIAGKIQSWDVQWYASAFYRGRVGLHPGVSLVQNIGFDGSGTHCGTHQRWNVTLRERPLLLQWQEPIEDQNARRLLTQAHWERRYPAPLKRWLAQVRARLLARRRDKSGLILPAAAR